MTPTETLFFKFGAALLAGIVLIPVVRRIAFRLGIVAKPREDRWHNTPTPMLGGVAIALIVLAGGLTIRPLEPIALLLGCGAVIALIGLVDDFISLKSSTKLIAQIVLASVFVYYGYRLHWTPSLTIDTIATLMWIVGITNALNLLDNMDGLCAGVGLIAGGALLASTVGTGVIGPEAHLLVMLMGALSAFLLYNVHPARIFMGDTGSLFVGLVLSGAALAESADVANRPNLLSIVAAPVIVLLIPIFDTVLVTLSRIQSGRSPSQGGRDHSSHRLVALGLTERAAVAVLWALAAIAGLIGVAMRYLSADWAGPLALVFVLGLVIFATYLSGVRVYDTERPRVPGGYTVMLVDFMYKRRFAEVVLDFCLVCLAYYSAYRLRFEGAEFVTAFPFFLKSLPVVIAVQLGALFVTGAYRATWRYFGLMDAVILAKGVGSGTLAIAGALLLLDSLAGYSRSTFVIYAALLMLLVTGSRASFRLISEFVARRASGPRVIVYTSSSRQSLMARDILATRATPSRLLGFVSDEPDRVRGYVQGYPVLGGYDDLLTLLSAGLADEVIVCAPGLDPGRLEELRLHCESSRVQLSQLRYDLEPLSEVHRPASNA
jgi:UDP-GlcNAc:undecaprenyl-phosphate/decaprenyl-phosphate GlcNAc-1-phosphate transferase